MSTRLLSDVLTRTAFEPAFALAQVETLRTVRAYMAPAAPLAVWALETCNDQKKLMTHRGQAEYTCHFLENYKGLFWR